MLPWVDGGHTWINYGIYSVLNLLLENIGERRPRVGQCFLFSPPSSICFFSLLHLSFEAPRRRLDLPVLGSSRPRERSDQLR